MGFVSGVRRGDREKMKVTPVKTKRIQPGDNLYSILNKYLPQPKENSIIAITSKIIAITEGRVIPVGKASKDALVKQECEYYLPKEENKYGFFLTITKGIIIASAGIDESNGNGYYVLWPQDAQKSANDLRTYLVRRFGLKRLGVIITDSKVAPLRRGVTGVAVAHSGFKALRNYIGAADIFGRKLEVTKANVADSLAAAAAAVMGEGNEQTPLAIIEDIPFVQFQQRNPSSQELGEIRIPVQEDIFASILLKARWRKGKQKSQTIL